MRLLMSFNGLRGKSLLAVVGTLGGLLLITSCKANLWDRCRDTGDGLGAMKSALLDPFRSVDDERFTVTNSAFTLVNFRAKPVTALAGKRQLNLEECRSIALANNLEVMAARTEELTKRAIEYSNRTRLLPHFLFSAELSQRDNPPYSFSDVLGQEGRDPDPAAGGGGTGVTNYSTSHERTTWRYSLETRWSPTDAALAYYVTRSSMNDKLKAHYQKVRVAQKLIALVDAAFYRVLALQRCHAQAQQLLAARRTVADKLKEAYRKKLVSVADYNRAQRQMVRAETLLTTIRTELEKQRNILASALGLSPDYCVDGGFVAVGELRAPRFDMAFCDMEMRALQNRPEAFEAGLNHLSSVNDYKRTIVKYFPKATGFWRVTRDKDRYLYNKDWKEVGLFVYFDLLDWLANVSESKAAGSHSAKTRQEMGAVALGLASQVRVAAVSYHGAMDQVRNAQSAERSSREVLQVAGERAARDDLDRLALEETKADVLQDSADLTRALGEANAALAELQGAMGTNYNERRPDK
ncbi:MAG: TolC family protein [Deltaproteobacteria bacterium]|nr:TolC family protein [Deltaproteobacteria bacterium]